MLSSPFLFWTPWARASPARRLSQRREFRPGSLISTTVPLGAETGEMGSVAAWPSVVSVASMVSMVAPMVPYVPSSVPNPDRGLAIWTGWGAVSAVSACRAACRLGCAGRKRSPSRRSPLQPTLALSFSLWLTWLAGRRGRVAERGWRG